MVKRKIVEKRNRKRKVAVEAANNHAVEVEIPKFEQKIFSIFVEYLEKHGTNYDAFQAKTGCTFDQCNAFLNHYLTLFDESVSKSSLSSDLKGISCIGKLEDKFIVKEDSNEWYEVNLDDDRLPRILKIKEFYLLHQLSLVREIYDKLIQNGKIKVSQSFLKNSTDAAPSRIEETSDISELENVNAAAYTYIDNDGEEIKIPLNLEEQKYLDPEKDELDYTKSELYVESENTLISQTESTSIYSDMHSEIDSESFDLMKNNVAFD